MHIYSPHLQLSLAHCQVRLHPLLLLRLHGALLQVAAGSDLHFLQTPPQLLDLPFQGISLYQHPGI